MDPDIVKFFDGSAVYKCMYLTSWCAVFQLTYFFICCVSDLVASSGAHSPLTRKIAAFRDWFLAAVAFPIGTLVVTVFWGLWAIDRELIFPKILDEFFPAWLNHVMHTTVLPILLLDMFLVRHRYPSKLTGILGLAVVALSYLSWILWLGFVADIWVYPFLKVMEGPVFVGFILTTSVLLLGMYLVGEKVSKVFWRGHTDYDFEMAKLD
ncbi:androgen-induced gene 1 protein-like isoform X4 [Patiria miniata]|uniref:Androgen-induced gene 1 protein-like n=1 Tax=Patiria miniata TaxID=46514 RepID=A0A913ZJ84_PATMI|nr:androgen-induced gene 1 protein-like isoform X4 [Patiria miniata]